MYRRNAATTSNYGKRDTVSPSLNVKSKTTAQARSDRYLSDMGSQHLRLSTGVIVPPAQVSQFKPGMRVPVLMTHMPSLSCNTTYMRVVSRTVGTVAAGELYGMQLEMVGGWAQQVDLSFQNTVLQDASRGGSEQVNSVWVPSGSVWQYEISQGAGHDPIAFTEEVYLTLNGVGIAGFGLTPAANGYGPGLPTQPQTGGPCAYIPMPTYIQTFTWSGLSGRYPFYCYAHTNGYTCGPASVDDSWTVHVRQLS